MEQTPDTYQRPPYRPPAPPTSGLATGSLILSILGLVGILPIIGSVVGLILGYTAKGQITESRGAMGGEGMADAGIIIGWVGVGLSVLGGCVALLVLVVLPILGISGASLCGLCALPFLNAY